MFFYVRCISNLDKSFIYFSHQLDKAIVTCYVGNFPLDSKRIHMGRVGASINADDDDEIPAPTRKRKKKQIIKKPTPKSKPGPASKKGKKVLKVPPKYGGTKKGVIVVNGRPVTGEYVTPKKGSKSVPAKKRRYVEEDDDDSDIEVIGSLAPPPLKKRKPGTKARY